MLKGGSGNHFLTNKLKFMMLDGGNGKVIFHHMLNSGSGNGGSGKILNWWNFLPFGELDTNGVSIFGTGGRDILNFN